MKRIFLLAGLLLMLITASVAAAPTTDPLVLNVDNWYRTHPMPTTPGITGEVVFQSPRAAVIVRQAPAGTKAAPHYHNISDEIVYIVAGSAEMLINTDWVKLKPGDVHVNPRGAVHALSVTDPKGCKFLSVFAPPQPAGGDATLIKDGEALQSPEGLTDTSPGTGMVVGLKEWQGAPVGGPDPNMGTSTSQYDMPDTMDNDGLKSVTISQSPRSAVTLRQAGYGARHRHTQDQGDEIIFVVYGSAHVDSGDSAYTIGKNYLQVIPMGAEHNMRLMLGESIRFITVFALPEQKTTPRTSTWLELLK